MFSLVSRNFLAMRNIALYSVFAVFRLPPYHPEPNAFDNLTLKIHRCEFFCSRAKVSNQAFIGKFWKYNSMYAYYMGLFLRLLLLGSKIWCIRFRSKHSTVLLLCLLRNLMHQTLHEKTILTHKRKSEWRFFQIHISHFRPNLNWKHT